VNKRLFIAIRIETSELLLSLLNEIKNELKGDNIKWVDPQHLHLTLAFLGDTEETIIENIITLMDSVGKSTTEFDIELNSLGVFKSINFPSVLWFGLNYDNSLPVLKTNLDNQLKKIRLKVDERIFKPHLTIARIKNIVDKNCLQLMLNKFCKKEILKQKVDYFNLYESILTPAGPIYRIIHQSFFCSK
jgi:RNA 2',3'-cyclic 3'-phosphodiesterase